MPYMPCRKTIRNDQKPPKAKSVDVTGLKLYMPQGKGTHPYFQKGGRFNP